TKACNEGKTQAEVADRTQGRRYDVYIVHAIEDREFVEEHLVQQLINEGYQVAWHDNMFIPGNLFVDDMGKAVKTSRRMLVVATGNLERSNSGIMEIREGRQEEARVHGYRITALVTETFPIQGELRPELFEIVHRRTHVVFTDRDYIKKICGFLPRPAPIRMASSRNSTVGESTHL
ncbi:unnamed protein product, partial [Meganyctiphanes norvegica]